MDRFIVAKPLREQCFIVVLKSNMDRFIVFGTEAEIGNQHLKSNMDRFIAVG